MRSTSPGTCASGSGGFLRGAATRFFFLVVITRLRLPLVVGNTWGEATPTSRLESSHRRVPIDHRTTSTHRGVTLGSLRRAAPLLVGVDPPPPVVSATSAGDRRGAMAVGSGARAVGDGGGGGVWGGGGGPRAPARRPSPRRHCRCLPHRPPLHTPARLPMKRRGKRKRGGEGSGRRGQHVEPMSHAKSVVISDKIKNPIRTCLH